jgi:hypothetical protein
MARRAHPFLTKRVLTCLEQRFVRGNGLIGRSVLESKSPSLLSLRASADAAANRTTGTPLARIGAVFQTMNDHFDALKSDADGDTDGEEEKPMMLHEVPEAACYERSVLFKWLCDELVSSNEEARFRVMLGELHVPKEAWPEYHAWVDISFAGEAAPATLRVDPTRPFGCLDPFLPLDDNGEPQGIEEQYHVWPAQSIFNTDALGSIFSHKNKKMGEKIQRDAIGDLVAAAAANPQTLTMSELFSTANAFMGLSLPPHVMTPLVKEMKKRLVEGTAQTELGLGLGFIRPEVLEEIEHRFIPYFDSIPK